MFVTAAAALECGRFAGYGTPWRYTATMTIATAVALLVMAVCVWHGMKLVRFDWPDQSHDEDSTEDRRRFLGYMTMLLAGLSIIATVYSAIAMLVVEGCA